MFLPRVMFVNITINSIYTINHGGQKIISILIHHYTYSIILLT